MIFSSDRASTKDLDVFLDPDNPTYGFATDSWVETPGFISLETENNTERLYRRQAHADAFKQHGSPVAWNRFVNLGFYVFDDCSEFDGYWRQFVSKQTFCSKVVWYNFTYHLDRNIDIPPKLLAWATELARPHIDQVDPSFLSIDTTKISWHQICSSSTISLGDEDRAWTLVGTPKSPKGSNVKSATPSLIKPPPRTSSKKVTIPEQGLSKLSSLRKAKAGTKTGKASGGILKASSSKPTNLAAIGKAPENAHPSQPCLNNPPPPPVHDSPMQSEDADMSETQASTGTSIPERIATNDGTHRLTFRWKPKKDYQNLAIDQKLWLENVLDILKGLFKDADGSFYRWESQDLVHSLSISELDPQSLRDFLSPKITSLDTLSTFIFGLRFRFATKKLPTVWRRDEQNQKAFKAHGVSVATSNSSCDSGKLVIAGYLLFKAPNTTHRARYLQFLRSQLPDNTPFFDIIVHKRTPTDQHFLHLVVQCGENHVTPLTAALSSILSGKGTAFFLPRLAFDTTISQAQVKKYFEMHQIYVRSLRPIPISPSITKIDDLRIEQFEDGTTTERTPQAWATSLRLSNGQPARCDLVNGSPCHQVLLLVPVQHLTEVREALSAYKFRLNVLGEREARFRDSLPGLPSEIRIDKSTQANLNFLEQLSSEEVWQQAPTSVRSKTSSLSSLSKRSSRTPPAVSQSSTANGSEDFPPLSETSPKESSQPQASAIPDSAGPVHRNPQSDEQTTASMQSSNTSSSISALLARLQAVESALDDQKSALQTLSQSTTTQFHKVEQRMQRLDQLDSTILEKMSQHQAESMNVMKTHFEGMMAKMIASFASHDSVNSSATSPTFPQQFSATSQQDVSPVGHDHSRLSAVSIPSRNKRDRAHLENSADASDVLVMGEPPGSPKENLPEKKLSRSLQTDMEQLSITEMDSDSDLSTSSLPPVPGRLAFVADTSSPWDSPSGDQSSLNTRVTPQTQPNQDTQYDTYSESDGGDVD